MKESATIPWKYILILFLILRVLTLFFAYLGLISTHPDTKVTLTNVIYSFKYPYADNSPDLEASNYAAVIKDGYKLGQPRSVFPSYFILIKAVDTVLHNYIYSGLLISNTCFILMLAMFYKLIRIDYDDLTAKKILLIFTFFPSSFFLLSLYAESLFLLLLFSTFYLLRINKYKLAAQSGFILNLTSIFGLITIPALFLEMKIKKVTPNKYIWLFLPILGLIFYMLYLYLRYDNLFLFMQVKDQLVTRINYKIVLIYQIFWRYLKMIVSVEKDSSIYISLWVELLSFIYASVLLILAWIKKIRASYLVFSLGVILLPTIIFGTLSIMPRYILMIFPIYIFLGTLNDKRVQTMIIAIHFALLALCTYLFSKSLIIA